MALRSPRVAAAQPRDEQANPSESDQNDPIDPGIAQRVTKIHADENSVDARHHKDEGNGLTKTASTYEEPGANKQGRHKSRGAYNRQKRKDSQRDGVLKIDPLEKMDHLRTHLTVPRWPQNPN
jgi:hypothetical protein